MQRLPVFPLPKNKTPTGTRCITIEIPDDDEWEQLAYTSLYSQLAMWLCWERDAGKWGTKIARQWRKALKTWRHCDNSPNIKFAGMEDDMPFFREVCENGKCYLEFQCCPDEWVRLANFDQINVNPQPSGTQPQPQPGGGSQQYCGTMAANNKFYIPTVVNSGDIIDVSASGSANDGGEVWWRCADGSRYYVGACIPSSTITDGGDPLPSAAHMSLIINIDGTFYYGLGSITVPGGVTNGQCYIQSNDSDISNNSGSYDICTVVTNNQSAPGTAWTVQFLNGFGNNASPHPFWEAYAYNGSTATYDAGSDKWDGTYSPTVPGENDVALAIKLTIPSGSTIQRVTADCKLQSTNPVGNLPQKIIIGGTTLASQNFGTDTAIHTFTLDTGVISIPGSSEIDITMDARGLVASGVPFIEVDAITIYGFGTNPFV